MRVLITAALCALGIVAATAARAEPSEAMGALAPLVGEWSVEVRSPTADGGWTPTAETTSVFAAVLDGAHVQENMAIRSEAFNYTLLSMFSWDQFRDKYRIIVFDKEFGYADVYEGGFDGDRLVVDNLSTGTFFPTETGKMHFRLSWEGIGTESFTFLVESSSDEGAAWGPFFSIVYTKP